MLVVAAVPVDAALAFKSSGSRIRARILSNFAISASGPSDISCPFLALGFLRRFGDSFNDVIFPRSSPASTIGKCLLNAIWVSFVRFFCTTICSASGSYLLTLMSNTKTFPSAVHAANTVEE